MKGNMAWNYRHWWDSLSSTLMAGTDGLGVYLDESGLTLVHVEKGLPGMSVQHSHHLPLTPGREEELAPLLKDLIASWGLEACPVSLAVSADLGFLRQVSLPRVAAENLAQVVAYELDRFLPLPAEKLYFDFQVLGESDAEIHLVLMAVPREPVERYLQLLTEATLRPISLELAPVAAANAFGVLAGKMPASWLVLHLEADSFELAQIEGPTLKSRHRGRGLAAKAMPREIKGQIEAMRQAGQDPKVLCLYGPGRSDLVMGALTAAELEFIHPNRFTLKGLLPEAELGRVLPAVGAALRSLGQVPLGANLLPGAERAAVSFGGFSITKAALLVFLGLVLLWAGSAFIHKRVVLYQVNRQIAALAPEARQVERQLEESRALARQIDSLRMIGQSPDKLKILKDLTQLIPENTWLFNLRLSKQNLDISGMSKSASDLIPLLEKSGWLQKTEFASPIVTDASKLEHFKIKAEIKGLESGS